MQYKVLIPLLLILASLHSVAQQKPVKSGSKGFKKMVWQDEFDGTGLPDSTKWNYEKGYVRNQELQYYTNARLENAKLENGFLIITALADSLRIGTAVYPVTSASLHTRGKQDWTYGRIEVRAKIPSSLGTWPAIWTLGTNITDVGWPDCGEIDIMEHVGYMPDTVHFNVHTKKYNHAINTAKGKQIPYKAPDKDFHIYAMEWFNDRIDWYMDNKKVFTFKNEGTGWEAWPFNKPQYLILNLAFGGAWGGAKGVDLNTLPQQFVIDYVRVFQ